MFDTSIKTYVVTVNKRRDLSITATIDITTQYGLVYEKQDAL